MNNNDQCARADSEKKVKFSIIIPAYNEEKALKRCLDSIVGASALYKDQVEIIVVLNRCTDRTEEIALSYHCVTVKNDIKNISAIRNAGAQVARGEILITVDADSWMADNMLTEIENYLMMGKYIGGGVLLKLERSSLGIAITAMIFAFLLIVRYGFISGSLFWCFKKDFDAIGGFDENLRIAEDVDFAIRLKKWGEQCGKTFKNITEPPLMSSARKYDMFGDWYMIKKPRIILDYFWAGKKEKYADKLYYNVKR